MRKHAKILSELERRVLPAWFLSWPCDFLDRCVQDPGVLFDLADALFSDAGIQIPYSRKSFSAETVRNDRRFHIVRLTLPAPDPRSACHCVYAVWDRELQKAGYCAPGMKWPTSGLPFRFESVSGDPEALRREASLPEQALPSAAPDRHPSLFRFRPDSFARHPSGRVLPACGGAKHAGIL